MIAFEKAVPTHSDDTTRTWIKDLSLSMVELSTTSRREFHESELML